MVTRTTAEETITVNKEKGYSMTYKYLGQTGIKVSVLSYGTWLNQVLSDEEGQKLVS